jgi:hypothetical protein
MNKLLSSVGLAIMLATASLLGLAGCQLYFGDHKTSSGDGNPPGFACKDNASCAAGCFCQDGICAEAGFCGADKDCGTGFHCDTGRSSCVPNPSCTANDDCPGGTICEGKACVATCTCTNDADAIRQGAGFCDEDRKTCMPGMDPLGACTGAITCTTKPPVCAEGDVPLIKDGCFTGLCRTITACEAAPACTALQYQNDCTSRTDCATISTGHECSRADGTACQPGDSSDVCKCKSFTFDRCEAQTTPTPRIIFAD